MFTIIAHGSLVPSPIPSFSMLHGSRFSACNIEKLGMGLGTRLTYGWLVYYPILPTEFKSNFLSQFLPLSPENFTSDKGEFLSDYSYNSLVMMHPNPAYTVQRFAGYLSEARSMVELLW